mgnify:CR=1 FL=1
MLNRNDALALILKGCTEKFEQIGFTTVVPQNLEKGAAPIFEGEEEAYLEFTKDDITLRLVSHDNLLDVTEKAGEGDFVKVESNLFDLEDFGVAGNGHDADIILQMEGIAQRVQRVQIPLGIALVKNDGNALRVQHVNGNADVHLAARDAAALQVGLDLFL